MKFQNLNRRANRLLNLKPCKVKRSRIYFIIRRHNAICRRLKRFNDFWKFYFQFEITFFMIYIWFLIYEVNFDYKLVIFNRLFFTFLVIFLILFLTCIFFMVYFISVEVTFNNLNYLKTEIK